MSNPIKEMIEGTVDKVSAKFTAETIVGKPVTTPDGTLIIPISRVSFGVGGGGSEFKATDKEGNNLFGGGVGAGASVKPEGFLVVTSGGSIRFVATKEGGSAVDKLIDYAPDMVEKVSGFFAGRKSDRTQE